MARSKRQQRLRSNRGTSRRPAAPAAAAEVSAAASLCRPGHELASTPHERAHPGDIASISRQFGYTPSPDTQRSMLAVPAGARCSHGFPQAFVYSPFGSKPNGGGCRLSCPLLVRAADELENRGGLREFRKDRLEGSSQVWRSRLRATNIAHAAHRCSLVSAGEAARAVQAYGAVFVRRLLGNGIAGMSVYDADDTTKRHDVKCFHAQLADWLCRVRGDADANSRQPPAAASGPNRPRSSQLHQQCQKQQAINPPSGRYIGHAIAAVAAAAIRAGRVTAEPAAAAAAAVEAEAAQRVLLPEEEEGAASLVGLRGEGLRCWTACDPMHEWREGDFAYEPQRNKIKLMHRARRRKEAQQAQAQAQQAQQAQSTRRKTPSRDRKLG